MGFFHSFQPGKGIKKEDVAKNFGFRRFFTTFGDKFWRLVELNLLYFLVNLPLFAIFAYLAGVGGTLYQTPAGVLFQPLAGVMMHTKSPALDALFGVVGTQVQHSYPSTVTNILLGVGLLSLVTFGLSNAALAFVQRQFVRGEPVDMAPDFFGCIKKNWKQSILLGILDLVFVFVIAFDLFSYVYVNQSFGFLIMLYLTIFLSVIYLLMRPYMYLLCVTFDLKIGKIIKNSWILAINGIGRGLFCGFFALLVILANYMVFHFIPSLGVGMLFILTVSIAFFFQIYGAWPVVKKLMIDPFYEEKEAGEEAESKEESVFEDRG